MENKVVGGKWLGPIDGLPHGFILALQPILSIFLESTATIAKKPPPTYTHGHWMGISSIKHCMLGSEEWRIKW
jgi:hypothetical protein